MGGTIFLGGARKKKQSRFATGLDVLSSVLLEPTTFIKSPTAAGAKVRKRRADIRSRKKGAAGKVIGEILTSTALAAGAILGAGTLAGRAVVAKVAPKLIPRTLGGAATAATGAGILLVSPTARKAVAGVIEDPTEVGRQAGRVIESAAKGEDVGAIGDVLKTAGIVGGAVAGGVAISKGVGFIKSKIKPAETAKSPTSTPTSAALPTSNLVPTQAIVSSDTEPVIAVRKAELTPSPSVTVNNNIKINNRSSANRRFINNVNV